MDHQKYTEVSDSHSVVSDELVVEPALAKVPFCERLKRLRVILLLMFCIGFVAATPSSIIPQLQQDAFGNSSFIITGGFSAGKGALGCVVIPLYGSFSDAAGRRTALLVAEALTVLPYAVYLISHNFWAYSAVDMSVGFHDGTMTLLLASVADIIPIATGSHTDSFALAVAMFFLGISLAPFLGAFLTVKVTFMCCGGMMLFTILLTYLFFYDKPRGVVLPLLNPAPPVIEEPRKLSKKAHAARLLEAFLSYPDLRLVAMVIFANGLAENLLDNLLLLYLDNTLNFTATQQSVVIAVLGVGSVFGLIGVTQLFRKYLGSLGTLRVALLANVVICALYSFVTPAWGIYAITTLSIVGMGVFPCACAVAALCLEEEAAGLAQGLASSARMLSSGVGPLFFGWLFEVTENTQYPGASFLVASGCVFLAFLVTRFLAPRFSTKHL